MTSLTAPIFSLLCLTPVIIAAGQILFKMAGEQHTTVGGPYYTILWNPLFVVAVTIYGIATLMWVYVLKAVPLTYAYSFMALTYIMVPLFASMWLGEALTLKYACGVALIIIGLLIVQS